MLSPDVKPTSGAPTAHPMSDKAIIAQAEAMGLIDYDDDCTSDPINDVISDAFPPFWGK